MRTPATGARAWLKSLDYGAVDLMITEFPTLDFAKSGATDDYYDDVRSFIYHAQAALSVSGAFVVGIEQTNLVLSTWIEREVPDAIIRCGERYYLVYLGPSSKCSLPATTRWTFEKPLLYEVFIQAFAFGKRIIDPFETPGLLDSCKKYGKEYAAPGVELIYEPKNWVEVIDEPPVMTRSDFT